MRRLGGLRLVGQWYAAQQLPRIGIVKSFTEVGGRPVEGTTRTAKTPDIAISNDATEEMAAA